MGFRRGAVYGTIEETREGAELWRTGSWPGCWRGGKSGARRSCCAAAAHAAVYHRAHPVRPAGAGEECLNDVVLLAWEKIESYDPKKGGFSAWLSALARNTARNRRRDGARRFRSAEELGEHLEDRRPGPEEALLHRERLELLQKAVDRLGDMDRNLFYRKYYYLQSTAQMAAELGLTERGVEGRLHRLRKRLRKELGVNWMADDREFDRLLEEELSALPLPDETVEEITPWKRAMTRIVWGVGLTTCTLNFWYLNYLLPAVGVVLLLLGFRTLRRENRWFAFCWAAAAVDAAAFFFLRVKDATLWSGAPVPFGEALALLQLAQSFCLWQGIKAVRRAAGQEDPGRRGGGPAGVPDRSDRSGANERVGAPAPGTDFCGSHSDSLYLHHAQPGPAARPAGRGRLPGAGGPGSSVRRVVWITWAAAPGPLHPPGGGAVLPLPHGVGSGA